MNTNLLKSGALALALSALCALPSLAQPGYDYGSNAREYRREQREYRREQRYNNGYDRANGYNRYNNGYRSVYTGVVTHRYSPTRFDVRISGRIYNVYTNDFVPRGLNRDDLVRVSGNTIKSRPKFGRLFWLELRVEISHKGSTRLSCCPGFFENLDSSNVLIRR